MPVPRPTPTERIELDTVTAIPRANRAGDHLEWETQPSGARAVASPAPRHSPRHGAQLDPHAPYDRKLRAEGPKPAPGRHADVQNKRSRADRTSLQEICKGPPVSPFRGRTIRCGQRRRGTLAPGGLSRADRMQRPDRGERFAGARPRRPGTRSAARPGHSRATPTSQKNVTRKDTTGPEIGTAPILIMGAASNDGPGSPGSLLDKPARLSAVMETIRRYLEAEASA